MTVETSCCSISAFYPLALSTTTKDARGGQLVRVLLQAATADVPIQLVQDLSLYHYAVFSYCVFSRLLMRKLKTTRDNNNICDNLTERRYGSLEGEHLRMLLEGTVD